MLTQSLASTAADNLQATLQPMLDAYADLDNLLDTLAEQTTFSPSDLAKIRDKVERISAIKDEHNDRRELLDQTQSVINIFKQLVNQVIQEAVAHPNDIKALTLLRNILNASGQAIKLAAPVLGRLNTAYAVYQTVAVLYPSEAQQFEQYMGTQLTNAIGIVHQKLIKDSFIRDNDQTPTNTPVESTNNNPRP